MIGIRLFPAPLPNIATARAVPRRLENHRGNTVRYPACAAPMPHSPATQAHNRPHLTDEMADIPSRAPAHPSVDTTINGRAPSRVIKRPAIAAPNAMHSRPTVSTLDKSDRLQPVSALMGIRST